MPSRWSSFLFAALLTCASSFLSAAPTAADEEEAQKLYSRANDYVAHIDENGYSYAYIQFYWKRAQANLERIARVYPDTKVGKQVVASEAKIGTFDLTYFKERVLPRLEEKKLAAFDPVNCAIFLYNLDEKRNDAARLGALQSVIEVLCRQQRWNEALSFPVLDEQKDLLLTTVFRVAARYQQKRIINELLANVTPVQEKLLWPILGEAMALNGTERAEIAKFLDEHPEPEVKLAILSGMIDREIGIQRSAAFRDLTKNGIPKTHYSILKLDVRDNVESVAQTFFPSPTRDSSRLVGKYKAAQGQKPPANASAEEHTAYLEYLAASSRFEELVRYVSTVRLPSDAQQAVELKTIELLAENGRENDSAALRRTYSAKGGPVGDAAVYADFRGKMNSVDNRLTVRERTFADLPLQDPCILAQAIMEWSLTPNRSIRGAAPWDPVVQRFIPGFVNLPLPKSKDVLEASGAAKPF